MDITSRPVAPVSVLKSLSMPENINRPDSVLKPLNSIPEPSDQSNPIMAESFETVLSRALEPVNDLQLQSADLDSKMASGNLEYVHQAMVMAQKASLALDFTLQIRNKVVEAYQEIMRTQV